MRKLTILVAAAALAGLVAAGPAAAYSCTPGPRGNEGDTVFFPNPVTDGKQYLNVDGDNGRVYAGTSNQSEEAYHEVVITMGDNGPEVDVYNRNTTLVDYSVHYSNGNVSDCGGITP